MTGHRPRTTDHEPSAGGSSPADIDRIGNQAETRRRAAAQLSAGIVSAQVSMTARIASASYPETVTAERVIPTL